MRKSAKERPLSVLQGRAVRQPLLFEKGIERVVLNQRISGLGFVGMAVELLRKKRTNSILSGELHSSYFESSSERTIYLATPLGTRVGDAVASPMNPLSL